VACEAALGLGAGLGAEALGSASDLALRDHGGVLVRRRLGSGVVRCVNGVWELSKVKREMDEATDPLLVEAPLAWLLCEVRLQSAHFRLDLGFVWQQSLAVHEPSARPRP
jgi:hypothetical protein